MSIANEKIMNLADGKVLYDDLRGRVDQKLTTPSTPGTSGQVLTSDGNGGQSWQDAQGGGGADGVTFTPSVSQEGVISWTNDGGRTNPQSVNIKGPKGDTGDPAPSSAVVPAVEDWLDENVTQETGYVLDRTLLLSNAAAPADLVGDLRNETDYLDNYVTITEESETEKTFNNEDNITSIEVSGNQYAFGNIVLCDRENILPHYPTETKNNTAQTVSVTYSGRFVHVTGTGSTSNSTIRPTTEWVSNAPAVEPGDYKIVIRQSGNYTITDSCYFNFYVGNSASDNAKVKSSAYIPQDATEREFDVTVPSGYSKMCFYIAVGKGFNGSATFWVGMYKSDRTFTDTEETVASDATKIIQIDPTDFPNGVDSVQHEAKATYHPAIQNYIDNLKIDINEELTYITPEWFGAVGDGTGDDSTALNACMVYAVQNSKVVRGFGKYSTASPVVIDGDSLDVFLNEIIYTGSDSAVKFAGMYNNLSIKRISATTTGAKGLYIYSSLTNTQQNTERNVIHIQTIRSNAECIYVEAATGKYLTYTAITAKVLASTASDCIAGSNRVVELSCYDTWFSCPSGWCFNGSGIKLFNCTLESNCYGGVYAYTATIQNCRARELMDTLMQGSSKYGISSGLLFKAKSGESNLFGVIIDIDDVVYYDSIDISEIVVPNSGTSGGSIQNQRIGRVNCPIIYGDLNYTYGHWVIGSRMILHGNDKICVPQFKSVITVTNADFDLRDETYTSRTWVTNRPIYPTKFIIDVEDCVIRLSPSYCSEGYNEFIVDMSNYMATIYDRRGEVLFDPETHQTGVYKFSAIVDYTIDDTYQHRNYPINSGYCDVWEIEKID